MYFIHIILNIIIKVMLSSDEVVSKILLFIYLIITLVLHLKLLLSG